MLAAHQLATLIVAVSTFQPQFDKQLVDPGTNTLTLSQGKLSAPLQGDLSKAALAWALTQRDSLGLPPTSTLVFKEGFTTRWGASLHLQQIVEGIEVLDGKVVVTVDSNARVVQVSSSVKTYAQVVSVWAINGDEALERAAKEVPLPALQKSGAPYGGAKKVFLKRGDELRGAWFTFVPTIDARANWYVGIDAMTGEKQLAQNRVFHAALDARVYAPSPGGLDAGVGVTPTVAATLTRPDGGSMVTDNDGGRLEGVQLTAYNCCVNKGCDLTAADAGPRRSAGTTMVPGIGNIQYDTVVCDRLQRASNDPRFNDGGSYEYPPIDPPLLDAGQPGPVVQTDQSHSDEFAEVHAFYQVNKIYDWVRGLSSKAAPIFPTNQPMIVPFQMRDEKRMPARKPAVWANVTIPKLPMSQGELFGYCMIAQPPRCTFNELDRVDNAAFLPREQFPQLILPELQLDVDTLMIFQGSRADFAYDSSVLWHEFGHGVVYATAALGFDTPALDNRSANNESGAMHEGFADFLSGAYGGKPEMGDYAGPRIGDPSMAIGVRKDPYLRTLDNTDACPNVLWGEVHQDAKHLGGALWKMRKDHFMGTDQGATFDAAFYAALVSMTPNVDFAAAVAIIASKVDTAFTGTGAAAKVNAEFTARGVIGCSKIFDMTNLTIQEQTRPYYGIVGSAGTGFAAGTPMPGPFQVMFKTPNGAKRVRVTGNPQGGANPFGGNATFKMLAKSGAPITFTRMGNQLINDAEKIVDPTGSGTVTFAADIAVPCGSNSAVYITLANTTTNAGALSNVRFAFDVADTCTVPMDAGTGDGGTDGGVDAGTGQTTIPVIEPAEGPAASGCGCSSVELGLGLSALALLMARRRRS